MAGSGTNKTKRTWWPWLRATPHAGCTKRVPRRCSHSATTAGAPAGRPCIRRMSDKSRLLAYHSGINAAKYGNRAGGSHGAQHALTGIKYLSVLPDGRNGSAFHLPTHDRSLHLHACPLRAIRFAVCRDFFIADMPKGAHLRRVVGGVVDHDPGSWRQRIDGLDQGCGLFLAAVIAVVGDLQSLSPARRAACGNRGPGTMMLLVVVVTTAPSR